MARSSPRACGPPSRPRSTRSSARVSPRSVIARRGDLGDDVLERRRPSSAPRRCTTCRRRCGSARRRAPGASPSSSVDVLGDRVEHPVAGEHVALVREVDRRQLELLARDVLPHVELGPVGDREHAHVLAAADAPVVEVPQLGPLAARVPLAEVVAEREDALLRAGALLVAARAAERGVEAVRLDRVEQRRGLQPVARRRAARSPRRTRPVSIDSCTEATSSSHRRARPRSGRGTRAPRGSCGRCRRASARTGRARAGTPCAPGARARSSPCRR